MLLLKDPFKICFYKKEKKKDKLIPFFFLVFIYVLFILHENTAFLFICSIVKNSMRFKESKN